MRTNVIRVNCDVCDITRYLDGVTMRSEDFRVEFTGNGDPEVLDLCPACFGSVKRYIGLIKDSEKNCV